MQVPEGNYRVTVRLGGPRPGATTLLAEQRRLMLEDLRTAKRQTQQRSFIVNVRTADLPAPPANAPGGDARARSSRARSVA